MTDTATPPPERPSSWQFHDLPVALKPLLDKDNWLLWRWSLKGAKWTKVPHRVDGNPASTTDPSTWDSYVKVTAAYRRGGFDGIGFVLTDDIAAFDVDDCRDRDTEILHPWAVQLVERCGSYAEVTISGSGIRIIGKASGDKIHKKRPVGDSGVSCELYRRPAGRYIVMTGFFLGTAPSQLADIDDIMDAVVVELGNSSGSNTSNVITVAEIEAKFSELNPMPIARDDVRVEHLTQDWLDLGFAAIGIEERYENDRSNAVFGFACHCLKCGVSENTTASCLWHWKIGEHIHEQDYPKRALVRTILRASAAVENFETVKGKIIANSPDNIRRAIAKMNIELSYDAFCDVINIVGLPRYETLDDDAAIEMKLKIQKRFRFMPPKELFYEVVTNLARHNGFHPVRNYLDSLVWDDTKRIDKWLVTYCGAADTKFNTAVGAIMLVAGVKRVRQPGCKYDEMVIFEAPQGTEKSEGMATLAVEGDWFLDDLPLNADGKKALEQTNGKWIVEAAEMSGMKRADVEHLKAFLSRQNDRGRKAYDRLVTDRPRQFIIVGTTNSTIYLRDITGNRRFWPVKIEKFYVTALKRDRDQLWAEAAAREAAGASIRLDSSLWETAAAAQLERMATDPWEEMIVDAIGSMKGKILNTDVWKIVNVDIGRNTQDQNARLGHIMKSLGFERTRKRFGGEVKPGYARGTEREQENRIFVARNRSGDVFAGFAEVEVFQRSAAAEPM
jgi:predicted P-loop ATPase